MPYTAEERLAAMKASAAEEERQETLWTAKLLMAGIVILALIAVVGHTSHGEQSVAVEERRSGFWGDVTATLDWCEANYDTTYYLAEFWNTISNFFFIAFALFGIWTARRDEVRIVVAYAGIASIGVGSALFHGTLLFEAQLCDELPMFYYILALLYICVEFDTPQPQHGWLAPALAVFAALFTVVYYIHPFPTLFQILWGIITVYTVWLIVRKSRLLPSHERFMMRVSVYALIAAAVVWIAEQALCSPFIRLFRMHALWHLGTAVSAYVSLTGVFHMRCRYVLRYPNCHVRYFLGLPYVVHDWPTLPAAAEQRAKKAA